MRPLAPMAAKPAAMLDLLSTADESSQCGRLLAEIRKITDLPIRFVVNTHYHLDHTGGNAVFAQAGATILAQRNLRGWLRTENLKFFGPNPKQEQKAMVEALVLPDEVYSDAVDIYLGTRQIQVRYMLGHTGGDLMLEIFGALEVYVARVPLAAEGRYRVSAPMDKDSELRIHVPLWDLEFAQRFPVGAVRAITGLAVHFFEDFGALRIVLGD